MAVEFRGRHRWPSRHLHVCSPDERCLTCFQFGAIRNNDAMNISYITFLFFRDYFLQGCNVSMLMNIFMAKEEHRMPNHFPQAPCPCAHPRQQRGIDFHYYYHQHWVFSFTILQIHNGARQGTSRRLTYSHEDQETTRYTDTRAPPHSTTAATRLLTSIGDLRARTQKMVQDTPRVRKAGVLPCVLEEARGEALTMGRLPGKRHLRTHVTVSRNANTDPDKTGT